MEQFKKICTGFSTLYYKSLSYSSGIEEINDTSITHDAMTLSQQLTFEKVVSNINKRVIRKSSYESDSSDSVYDSSINSSARTLPAISDTSSSSSEDDNSSTEEIELQDIVIATDISVVDIIPPILIKGIPGTGKSFLIDKVVHYCIAKELKVLFAYATADMARATFNKYKSPFVTSDTIHSLFRIPIDGNEPIMNWNLTHYDLLVIDEVGMVNNIHIGHTIHCLKTLPIPLPSVSWRSSTATPS